MSQPYSFWFVSVIMKAFLWLIDMFPMGKSKKNLFQFTDTLTGLEATNNSFRDFTVSRKMGKTLLGTEIHFCKFFFYSESVKCSGYNVYVMDTWNTPNCQL